MAMQVAALILQSTNFPLLHHRHNRSTGEFVRLHLETSDIIELAALVPKVGHPYYLSHQDIAQEERAIRHRTGLSVFEKARFPCRLYTLLDLVAWNETYGFLAADYLLTLYPTDPEVQLSHATHNDTFVFAGKHVVRPRDWGDLHVPLETFAGSRGLPGFGRYDLVLFAQTLEHLYDPVLCLRNLYRAMAPGGFLFTSVPMLNHLHMEPFFFSEPTPYGLVVWMKQAGFEVLRVGVFGNQEYMENLARVPTRWISLWKYYNESRRPQIINDPRRPVQSSGCLFASLRKAPAPHQLNQVKCLSCSTSQFFARVAGKCD